jgi:hypothetical protein
MFFFRKAAKKEIFYKTDDEVEAIRTSCLMVCDTLAATILIKLQRNSFKIIMLFHHLKIIMVFQQDFVFQ